jgi:hypothetical protein
MAGGGLCAGVSMRSCKPQAASCKPFAARYSLFAIRRSYTQLISKLFFKLGEAASSKLQAASLGIHTIGKQVFFKREAVCGSLLAARRSYTQLISKLFFKLGEAASSKLIIVTILIGNHWKKSRC